MFPFITQTWNPLGGACPHECVYCWARDLSKRYGHKKYSGQPRIIEKELKRKFKPNDFVFVQDMTDLFADTVSLDCILAVFEAIEKHPKTQFLLLTKCPDAYFESEITDNIPDNAVLGATIETDKETYEKQPSQFKKYSNISLVGWLPKHRLEAMQLLDPTENRTFISVEPILVFSDCFAEEIRRAQPWAVAVGYDNYNHKLPEPPVDKTKKLIANLEMFTKVYRKTLRKAWWE